MDINQTVQLRYENWTNKTLKDNDLNRELQEIAGDREAVFDRFYRDLEFGTGGLRGVIGAGTNRMNIYTVAKATQGYANYLNQAAGDRQILAKQLNISPHQLSYVTNSGEGEGLIFYGNVIIPFKDRFNHNLRLYSLMTTRPSDLEKHAGKGA